MSPRGALNVSAMAVTASAWASDKTVTGSMLSREVARRPNRRNRALTHIAIRLPAPLLYEVGVDGYAHVVPVVREGRILFLKTIHSSRKANRKRRQGEPR